VGCTSATKADRELLTDADARERHVWSCSMMCSAPLGQRGALLVERRWRQPVLFLDSNNDGAFDPTERHEFPRTGDLHIRIPVTIGLFTQYPITIRYRWELFKPRGDPERRMLLESPMVFVGGTVTIAGRPVRVEYPVSPALWPEVTGGWFIEHASRTLGPKGLTVIGLPDDWERKTAEPVISRFRPDLAECRS